LRHRPTSGRSPVRIHLTGASGSGTTTLGAVLAQRLSCPHFDTDSFYWLPTDPPFRDVRPVEERLGMLEAKLASTMDWILSGSLDGWGDPLIVQFDLVVFLTLDPAVRMDRIRARERSRYGAAILPGGAMHEGSVAFLEWAAGYDDAGPGSGRSRKRHEAWLARLPCPILRLDTTPGVTVLADAVVARISQS
jgi:adenylate kinase family enzyme